jgi:uncharacterized protein YycO
MKKITLHSHRGDSLVSKAIMRASHGGFSHSSAQFENIIYESVEGQGFIKTNIISWKHSPIIESYEVEVTEEQYDSLLQWSEEQVGKKYDYTGVLAHISPLFFKPRMGYWYCSEYAFVLLNKAKGIYGDDISHHKVSPQLFRDIARITGGVKKIV